MKPIRYEKKKRRMKHHPRIDLKVMITKVGPGFQHLKPKAAVYALLSTLAVPTPIHAIDIEALSSTTPERLRSGLAAGMAFSPDGTELTSVGFHTRRVSFWDHQTADLIDRPREVTEAQSIAYSPDGTLLAIGLANNTIRLMDMSTRSLLPGVMSSPTTQFGVSRVEFSPDGTTLVSSGWGSSTILLWDVETQNKLGRLRSGSSGRVFAIHPDGGTIIAGANGSSSPIIRVFDATTQSQLGAWRCHRDGTHDMAFSPDGTRLATSGGWNDRTVYLWNVSTEEPVDGKEPMGTLGAHPAHVGSVAFSPDGTLMATTAYWNNFVYLWDAATLGAVAALGGHNAWDIGWDDEVTFRPDGKWLAAAGDRGIEIWGPIGASETENDGADQILAHTIGSQALTGNLIGEDPSQSIYVYLPDGYHDGDDRYPVVYWIPFGGNTQLEGFSIESIDEAIQSGQIPPTIIVFMPVATRHSVGTVYLDSDAFGHWEEFFVSEVIPTVDSTYRTLATPQARGIVGSSVGGFSALMLPILHPNTWGAVGANDPSTWIIPTGVRDKEDWSTQTSFDLTTGFQTMPTSLAGYEHMRLQSIFGQVGAKFSPNPESPILTDLQLDRQRQWVPEAREKWREFDILDPLVAANHRDTLLGLSTASVIIPQGSPSETNAAWNRDLITTWQTIGANVKGIDWAGGHTDFQNERFIALLEEVVPAMIASIAESNPALDVSLAGHLITDGEDRLLRLEWPTQTGTEYILQFKEQVGTPEWIDLKQLTGTGEGLTEDVSIEHASGFYRLILRAEENSP